MTPLSERFVRGDTNEDGSLELSDAVRTLTWLFQSATAPACRAAADSNDDGALDLSDAVFSLAHLFLGGEAPPPPFPDCGTVRRDQPPGCVQANICR